jgi:predicted phage terminase large subunit-like protein
MNLSNLDFKCPIAQAYLRKRCEKDFLFYCRYMFYRAYGRKFQVKPFHIQITDALQEVAEGKCPRLIINIPPRFGKTQLAVKYWASWIIAINPNAKFIHTSYSQGLALDNSSEIKAIIKSEEYQDLWQVDYRDDAKAKEKWYTLEGGGMLAAAHGGQITGFGAGDIVASPFCGALIIDDPLKADDAYSDVYRNRANTRYDETLINRLNHENVPIVVIMQRLHEDDLTGYLEAKTSRKFKIIKVPVLDDDNKSIWEERFSTEFLLGEQSDNPRSFAGQYMQEPAPSEGNIININWFNYYDRIEGGEIFQSWDTANKDGEENDYSACTTWLVKDSCYYLLDVYKEKLQFPDLVVALKKQYEKWKPRSIVIEDKASGQQLLQTLRRETSLPIVAYNPKQMSKAERMNTASIDVEAGRVYLKNKAVWLEELLHELKVFPNGKYKDTGDSFSMFINWYKSKRKTFNIASF